MALGVWPTRLTRGSRAGALSDEAPVLTGRREPVAAGGWPVVEAGGDGSDDDLERSRWRPANGHHERSADTPPRGGSRRPGSAVACRSTRRPRRRPPARCRRRHRHTSRRRRARRGSDETPPIRRQRPRWLVRGVPRFSRARSVVRRPPTLHGTHMLHQMAGRRCSTEEHRVASARHHGTVHVPGPPGTFELAPDRAPRRGCFEPRLSATLAG